MTFADFAITEGRFRKHFRMAPPDTWNERMLPLAEFLELDEDEREGRFPFVWTVDRKQQLARLLVDRAMVESSEDRRAFWRMLRSLAGVEEKKISREEIETQVRQEVVGRIASGLMQLAGDGGDANALLEGLAAGSSTAAAAGSEPQGEGAPTLTNGMAPWIDSPECTACDDCIDLNPEIFAYGDDGKAYIKDASAGPYSDLVKAAERCTARVIHPGLPRERGSKAVEKWIARGEKYN
jgi:pyruvate-ferredoxin/flavodoxin oxidoreductase